MVLRLTKGLSISECHFQQLFASNLLPFVNDCYLWWHSILAGGPEACQSIPNSGVPLSATICEQLAAICERYLPMVTQHFAGGPEACQRAPNIGVLPSATIWATCCHLWTIFTYGDTAFWLEVLRPAKGLPILECHFQQPFVSNLLPLWAIFTLVTQHFGWMSWGLPKQLFVSNLLPFVSYSYLWCRNILAGGP